MPEPIKLGAVTEADLRKYLLGDASIQDQEKVDTWLMTDDEAYDLLEAAEDDLIDAALAGRLDRRDFQLFNDHFLAAPERQRKYQFSRSFLRAVDSVS
jgi:anti-sigma factor RsiW